MKPIIFNTMMVQAILEGRKTQTRRVVKAGNHTIIRGATILDAQGCPKYGAELNNHGIFVAQYQKGDVLWVRETWNTTDDCGLFPPWPSTGKHYMYLADAPESEAAKEARWRPSIHMPREAARIFLRVTDVRVERLQDIDENGAIAEGLYKGWRLHGRGSLALSARQAFMWLWRIITLKTPGAVSWACNPWVWVYTFERCEPEE